MKNHLATLFLFLTPFLAFVQVEKNSDLYKTILSKDSLLFNIGFNTCDIKQVDRLLSDSLTFYHDKDGLCDKQTNRQVQRFLVEESKLELNRDNSFNLKETMDRTTLLKTGNWSIDVDTLRLINTKDTKNKEWANQSYLIQADSLGKISVGAYAKIKN